VERDQVKPDLVKPGLEDSLLLRGVMKCWGVGTLEELVLAANASPPPDFAALFRTVLAASHGDDVIAKRLLQRAGAELAGLAGVVMGQLFHGKPSVPVAMSGGVFANSALVREAFDDTLRRESSATAIRPEMVEPVLGALARARRGGAA
jgi:N-acetylglucosamine kinase-like BadF-type ATPase